MTDHKVAVIVTVLYLIVLFFITAAMSLPLTWWGIVVSLVVISYCIWRGIGQRWQILFM